MKFEKIEELNRLMPLRSDLIFQFTQNFRSLIQPLFPVCKKMREHYHVLTRYFVVELCSNIEKLHALKLCIFMLREAVDLTETRSSDG